MSQYGGCSWWKSLVTTCEDLKASRENVRPCWGESQMLIHPKFWLSQTALQGAPSQLGETQLGLTGDTQDETTLLSVHPTGFCPKASCQLLQGGKKIARWEKRAEQG